MISLNFYSNWALVYLFFSISSKKRPIACSRSTFEISCSVLAMCWRGLLLLLALGFLLVLSVKLSLRKSAFAFLDSLKSCSFSWILPKLPASTEFTMNDFWFWDAPIVLGCMLEYSEVSLYGLKFIFIISFSNP